MYRTQHKNYFLPNKICRIFRATPPVASHAWQTFVSAIAFLLHVTPYQSITVPLCQTNLFASFKIKTFDLNLGAAPQPHLCHTAHSAILDVFALTTGRWNDFSLTWAMKLEHEIFYGESEDEVAEQVNRFSLYDWVDWVAEEDYMEDDRSYATVLYYYMLDI